MALAFTNKVARVVGDRVEIDCDYTGDTSYATGGYTLTPSAFDLDAIERVTPTVVPVAAAGVVAYKPSTAKLLLYTTLTGTEVVNTTNVSTVTGHLVIRGPGRASFSS